MNRPTLLVPSTGDESADLRQRWVWTQTWRDLLFLHWRVPSPALRRHVASELTIDEYEGEAWVSLVLFKLRVRPAWLPFLPGFSNLVEVNLRTYVRHRGVAGITFLSVHAHNRFAIFLARRLTPMPYQWAALKYQEEQGTFQFDGSDRSPAGFRLALQFQPGIESATTRSGTLQDWLLERYRLFLPDDRQGIVQADVSHPPWQVHDVDVSLTENSAGARFGLDLGRAADLAHFSRGVHAHFGTFGECYRYHGVLPRNI